MTDQILRDLFPQMPAFLTECWPETPAVSHGEKSRISFLRDLPELRDLASWLKFADEAAEHALLYLGELKDESEALVVAASDLTSLMRSGAMFSFAQAQRTLPGLEGPLDALREQLALPAMANPRCIVYGAHAGPGAAWHWDAGANFIVQLDGVKRWHLADNTVLPQPPDRYSLTMKKPSTRLEPYLGHVPCTPAPEQSRTIDLRPGSVLFLPAGHWHSTETLEDSLAINFTFGQPSHARVLASFLARSLQHDPRWRKLAMPGRTDSDFDGLLGELVAERPGWSAAEIYGALDMGQA